MIKSKREWLVKAAWGNIQLRSYGDPRGAPVLLAHGRQDSASTFIPLLNLLPVQGFYYVAVNMPGSGRSDPLPIGVKILRFHFMGAMEAVVDHLGWDKFIFIGHSMGGEIGLFYNAIHPGRISKMVLLDAEPTLRRLQVRDLAVYHKKFYDDYYNNYEKENYLYRTYTIPQATKALMKARNLTEDKAAIIVSDSLIHIKDDQYRFTWDRRLKLPAPQNYPNTYYFELFKNLPPTLLVSASESLASTAPYTEGSIELLKMLETIRNFYHVQVEGDHDVHLSHPDRVAPYVRDFLKETKRSKL